MLRSKSPGLASNARWKEVFVDFHLLALEGSMEKKNIQLSKEASWSWTNVCFVGKMLLCHYKNLLWCENRVLIHLWRNCTESERYGCFTDVLQSDAAKAIHKRHIVTDYKPTLVVLGILIFTVSHHIATSSNNRGKKKYCWRQFR